MLSLAQVVAIVLALGGKVSFKWPKYAAGWSLSGIVAFHDRFGWVFTPFHGCAFGLVSAAGTPMFEL